MNPRARWTHAALAALAIAACRPTAPSQAADAGGAPHEILRVAYQRSSWSFLLLRSQGALERALGPNVEVRWIEMTAGAPIMEALNVDGADVGSVGDAPAVFAQAAGDDFEYVAVEPAKPDAVAIVVPAGSRRARVSDLRGATIGVQKASTAHHLLVRALDEAGLRPADVHVSFLSPPDALAAFGSGRLDAWAVWDPYFAQAELTLGARALRTARGILPYYTFYVARHEIVRSHRALVDALLRAVAGVDRTLVGDPDGSARVLSHDVGIDERVLARSLRRMHFGVEPFDDAARASQAALASLFASLGLVPPPRGAQAAAGAVAR